MTSNEATAGYSPSIGEKQDQMGEPFRGITAQRAGRIDVASGGGSVARAYHLVLRIARTFADLAGTAELGTEHVSEAIQYQSPS